MPRLNPGLPWWLSGEESAYQCRRHGFDPWSGRISYATEQLSLCAKKENICVCVYIYIYRERERERLNAALETPGLRFSLRYQKSQLLCVLGKGSSITEVLPSGSSLPVTMLLNSLHHWHWLWAWPRELPSSTGPQKGRYQQELDESLYMRLAFLEHCLYRF